MVLRLTALASAMAVLSGQTAVAQTPVQTASTESAPPASADQDKILLQADVLTEDRTNFVTIAEGNVEVRYQGRILRTDKLIFDQNKNSMRAQGKVQITNEDGTVTFADEIEGDQDFTNGFATGFSAKLGTGLATASSAVRVSSTKNILEHAVYTACPVCADGKDDPTWQLRARTVMLDQKEQMVSYQDAVLEIKGIPVIYLPYFAHADPTSERRSGFLKPDIGVSSKFGLFYEQPYYFALSPSQDVTVSPMIAQGVAPLIKVDYRKRFFSGFVSLESSVTYEQEFGSDGDKSGDDTWRSHLYGYGAFDINKEWKWGFGVERQTDDLYDHRYDIDAPSNPSAIYYSQPRQLLTQLYTIGQRPDFYFEAGTYLFQGLRESDDDARIPKVTPSLFVQKDFDLGAAGQIATGFSVVGLFRDATESRVIDEDPTDAIPPVTKTLLDTVRTTASADWGTQVIVGPGLVLQPFASGRGDYYYFDDGGGAGKQEVGRFLGVAGAQLSYPFIRRGKTIDIVIEPIVMAAYGTPDANDDGIPNEDSQLVEADESNLFKPNPINGYDLWEGGARAAVGLSASAQMGAAYAITGVIGRRWRESEDPAFNTLSNLRNEKSDYVASVKLNLGPYFTLGSRLRLDDGFAVNRTDVDATASVGPLQSNVRYYKIARNAQNLEDEGLAWEGRFKFTKNLEFGINQSRNITAHQDIRLVAGIAYIDECSMFSLTYERSGTRDRTLGPTEAIHFNFVLTGLGGVADSAFD